MVFSLPEFDSFVDELPKDKKRVMYRITTTKSIIKGYGFVK
jgi:hypothetical protein